MCRAIRTNGLLRLALVLIIGISPSLAQRGARARGTSTAPKPLVIEKWKPTTSEPFKPAVPDQSKPTPTEVGQQVEPFKSTLDRVTERQQKDAYRSALAEPLDPKSLMFLSLVNNTATEERIDSSPDLKAIRQRPAALTMSGIEEIFKVNLGKVVFILGHVDSSGSFAITSAGGALEGKLQLAQFFSVARKAGVIPVFLGCFSADFVPAGVANAFNSIEAVRLLAGSLSAKTVGEFLAILDSGSMKLHISRQYEDEIVGALRLRIETFEGQPVGFVYIPSGTGANQSLVLPLIETSQTPDISCGSECWDSNGAAGTAKAVLVLIVLISVFALIAWFSTLYPESLFFDGIAWVGKAGACVTGIVVFLVGWEQLRAWTILASDSIFGALFGMVAFWAGIFAWAVIMVFAWAFVSASRSLSVAVGVAIIAGLLWLAAALHGG